MVTNKSFLPEPDTKEAKTLIVYYETCTDGDTDRLAKEYGYKNRSNFISSMRKRLGAKRVSEQASPDLERVPIVVTLPPVKLRDYKHKKARRGDEEIALLHNSCGHAGKITKSFDEDAYNQRMDTMFDSTMAIITLHRNMYPINTLHIVNVGDNVTGENPFQGSKVGTITVGARDQTTKIAYPAWVITLASASVACLARYLSVVRLPITPSISSSLSNLLFIFSLPFYFTWIFSDIYIIFTYKIVA